MTSVIRFSFFPIVEETPKYLWVAESFVLFLFLSIFIQYKKIEAAFESPRIFKQTMIFNVVNLMFFLYANLHWNFSETRLLFLGLFPLFAIVLATLIENFGKGASFVAIAVNGIYLVSLW